MGSLHRVLLWGADQRRGSGIGLERVGSGKRGHSCDDGRRHPDHHGHSRSGPAKAPRFVGLNFYDPLMKWDLSRSDVVANLVPGFSPRSRRIDESGIVT